MAEEKPEKESVIDVLRKEIKAFFYRLDELEARVKALEEEMW